VIMAVTFVAGKKEGAPTDIPVSESLTVPATTGWLVRMDNIWLWVIVAIVLILIAYGPFFLTYSVNMVSPGFKAF